MNPYVLPEGNIQIAFSGGRTSGYMLHQILEANGGIPDRAVVSFQNTGREMPETLDFVQEVGARWGVPIVWLEYRGGPPVGFEIVSHNSASRNGEPFEALIRRRKFLPNQQSRFCTTELKIRTAKRYLVSLGWTRWTNVAGLRADEPQRLKGLPRSWSPAEGEVRARDRWIVSTPLADAGVSKHDVALFWRRQPFDLRLHSFRGKTPMGNCDACFLKSEEAVANVARDYPARHAWWENMEGVAREIWNSMSEWQRLRRIIENNPELHANLRKCFPRPISTNLLRSIVRNYNTVAFFSKRYSRKSLREHVERMGPGLFDIEGALCQVDDGECTG